MSIAVLTLSDQAASDGRLAWEAARGDRAAFAHLYERHARLVHVVLLARVPYAHVEDLKQDVFLRAFQHIDRLRDGQAFAGWICQIARNAAADFQRNQKAAVPLDDHMRLSQPAPPAAYFVLDAIRALPEAYRETLVLRLVEGFTGPEIAAQTGLTPESVRVNLHRGMKLLREKLA